MLIYASQQFANILRAEFFGVQALPPALGHLVLVPAQSDNDVRLLDQVFCQSVFEDADNQGMHAPGNLQRATRDNMLQCPLDIIDRKLINGNVSYDRIDVSDESPPVLLAGAFFPFHHF